MVQKFSFELLSGLTIRGSKEGLYRAISQFALSTDSEGFGGVYNFDGKFAVKLFLNEGLTLYKWLSIPETLKSATSYICEISEATRDAEGNYEGTDWKVSKGEHQIKVIG